VLERSVSEKGGGKACGKEKGEGDYPIRQNREEIRSRKESMFPQIALRRTHRELKRKKKRVSWYQGGGDGEMPLVNQRGIFGELKTAEDNSKKSGGIEKGR